MIMENRKLDGATLQDLFHHSLAMQGEDNCVDAYSLTARCKSASRVRDIIFELEGAEYDFLALVCPADSFRREAELIASGRQLFDKVTEFAALAGIDARSGERNEIKCVVCGKPAMTKATQCYFHAFLKEFSAAELVKSEGSK